MYHQWQEFSLFELDPLQLSALYTHSGGGKCPEKDDQVCKDF